MTAKKQKNVSTPNAKVSAWRKGFLLFIGLGGLILLVNESGTEAIQKNIQNALIVLPFLLLMEGCRIGCEALSSFFIITAMKGRAPWSKLLSASLVSYSVCILTPIGRPVGEAVRGTMLASFIGQDRAFVMSSTNQALILMSNAVLAIAVAIYAVTSIGLSMLTTALMIYACLAGCIAIFIQVLARWRGFVAWIVGVFPKYWMNLVRYYRSAKQTAHIPIVPLLAMIASRSFQAIQIGLLSLVLGLGFNLQTVLLGQGINLVGSAIGDWIPAQLGSVDGAFALAAPSIGATTAVGLTIAVFIHCVQLFWVVIGSLVPLLTSARTVRSISVRVSTSE